MSRRDPVEFPVQLAQNVTDRTWCEGVLFPGREAKQKKKAMQGFGKVRASSQSFDPAADIMKGEMIT